ncbi:Ubiquitin conjugation factor E4 [Cyanidiococcus yangmingshanensis]|uniref:Ubiquitin conjugation factor E4 n=1 Tax=Cyanidiococcus yangmingshanensis TaxID=2690220 RepID=A0A7J7IDE7_9RHOD|nr:Ubiquitin conjugation factor E4 [Cyanidiococcus yangmingshanensis]
MFSGRRARDQDLDRRRNRSEDGDAAASAADDNQTIDAELVRRRRLARFSSTSSVGSRPTDKSELDVPDESTKERSGLRASETASKAVRDPRRSDVATTSSAGGDVVVPIRRQPTTVPNEELIHQSLASVLDLRDTDLAEIRRIAGLPESEGPHFLTAAEFDALLAERLQDPRIGDALSYLAGCYHRARQELASIQAARSQELCESLRSTLPLLVTYARTCLCEPSLFVTARAWESSRSTHEYAATWILEQFGLHHGESGEATNILSPTMYVDMVHWWARDAPDELAQVLPLFLRGLIQAASIELEKALLQKAPLHWLQSLGAALEPPEALLLFVSMEEFVAADTRTGIRSLLGPFFTPTALHYEDDRVSRALFPNTVTNEMDSAEREAVTAVQWSLDTLRDGVYRLLLRLLRSGSEPRERILTWIANQLNTNTERMKIQAAASETSTDGYMLNLTDVLLRLAAPFADPRSPKLKNVSHPLSV